MHQRLNFTIQPTVASCHNDLYISEWASLSAALFEATAERIHPVSDSRIDHSSKAEKGNEGEEMKGMAR